MGSMMERQRRRQASSDAAFDAKQAAPDPPGGRKRELPREQVTTYRGDRMASWIGAMLLVGVFAFGGCTVGPEAGQAAALASAAAPAFDAQADALEATNPERAAMFREWADMLEVVAAKIEAAIEDGLIDGDDAFREIAPFLDQAEQDVLAAALTLLQPGAATPDSFLAVVQQAFPIFLPGFGILGAGLIAAIRSVFTQKKNLSRVVAGMGLFIEDNQPQFAEAADRVKLAMGDQARKAVKDAQARNAKAAAKVAESNVATGTATPV